MRELLRDHDASLCLGGQVVSAFGDSALWLAMGIWIKLLTGSTSLAGLSFFALALGALTGPLSGWLVDRARRRRLLIAANTVAMVMVLLLLLVQRGSQVWLIYAVVVGYGAASALIGPAQTALVQTVVQADLLGEANSVMQTAQQGFRLVAPLIGPACWPLSAPGRSSSATRSPSR